jgi:hypothetical protein
MICQEAADSEQLPEAVIAGCLILKKVILRRQEADVLADQEQKKVELFIQSMNTIERSVVSSKPTAC